MRGQDRAASREQVTKVDGVNMHSQVVLNQHCDLLDADTVANHEDNPHRIRNADESGVLCCMCESVILAPLDEWPLLLLAKWPPAHHLPC